MFTELFSVRNHFISHENIMFRHGVPVIAVLMSHRWTSSWRLVKAGVSFLCHPVHILPDGHRQGKIHLIFLRVRDAHVFLEKHDYLIR